MTALIIHGHFYQPPRENPWTGEVEREKGAEPFHDWNEKIHAECYAANAFARIIGSNGVDRIVNNYESISYNFGPTLLSWLERHHRLTYDKIIEADRISASSQGGHGNAIAQAYGHAILPLANTRDRLTQVIWGVADFRHRFGREPEALWLPETAANNATLDVLIEQEMRYVILAPDQAEAYKLPHSNEWISTSQLPIDTSHAYQYLHSDGSGRSIAIFFYDGQASRAIAFERVLTSSELLVDLFERSAVNKQMVNVATDGETYGHHFKFGDLCLAHALEVEASNEGFNLTNYGEYLDHNPATRQVKIRHGATGEGSSWSCIHGVSRWIRDCGCHTGGEPGWNQSWRGPLRAALDVLRDRASEAFESAGNELLNDPWAARNDYISVILTHGQSLEAFLRNHAKRPLSATEESGALKLLELQHYALLMFTSCGWFFSELSGIETVQVMKYAARVLELMEDLGFPSPRGRFLQILSGARSNLKEKGTGADIFLREAEPSRVAS
jgi:alpha-amylase/alpha-mannosidase (GH57 family)